MPRQIVKIIILGVFIGCAALPTLGAGWPSQLTIAGMGITGVQGSVNPDGSGTATGMLQLAGNPKVQLRRSSSGEVSGTCSINAAMSGAVVQGSFTLDADGLRGKGSLHTSPKDIVDASIDFDTSGQASGEGRVNVGSASLPVRFSVSPSSLDVTGSAPARARADTPLASYEFAGDLRLNASGGRIALTAQGMVTRTGKLAQQISTHRVSDAPVDFDRASLTVNVDGVSVVFQLTLNN